jgi:multidrug resistance efflux pump
MEEQKPQNRINHIRAQRSEEIADIIDRMPTTFGYWTAGAVLFFAALLFLFAYIIKYPDVVCGIIKISSGLAPVKLVANTSGALQLLSFAPQQNVSKGDYIAVLQNPAVTDDVRRLAVNLRDFDLTHIDAASIDRFPEKLSLGELNLDYYSFLSALKCKYDYERDNIFQKQKLLLEDDIAGKEQLLADSEEILQTTQTKLDIAKKWFAKHSENQHVDDLTIFSELETDQSHNDYLNLLQEKQNYSKEISSLRMQILEIRHRLNQLLIEQRTEEREIRINLITTYHKLNDNIKLWEQKFVFIAPMDGKVEFLKFIAENQFVQSGEEIFGIIPGENELVGHVLLPTEGAGKVKVGNRVSIKLVNYPYLEYGSIDGVVKSISMISQQHKFEQGIADVYLIYVDLPNGLTTNYGRRIAFEHEISGEADIIVNERRLIERLFDNLKYNTK